MFLNPCSPEENNGNNYRETKEHKSGETYYPDGTIGSFLIEVKRRLISHTGSTGAKSALALIGFAAASNPALTCFWWAVK